MMAPESIAKLRSQQLRSQQLHHAPFCGGDTHAGDTHWSCPSRAFVALPQAFEGQVLQKPEHAAVIHDQGCLTYAELNTRVNQLAHHLKALGATTDVLVGVCLARSPQLLVTLLAILKTGAAYIPLDPAYPAERIALMVEDSGLTLLVTQETFWDSLPASDAKLVLLDLDAEAIGRRSDDNLGLGVDGDAGAAIAPQHLAYQLYTSGSTGKPKGVQIPHGAVANFLQSMAQEPGLGAQDRLLAVTTVCFDIAVLELFLPLTVGATVVLASRAIAQDGVRLAQLMETSGATVMQATPATWRLLLASGWQGRPQLKILCGGEAMTRDLAQQLLPRCQSLWNMYGPTETTVWSAIHRVEPGDGPVPIGQPIAHTEIVLLGHDHETNLLYLVPQGESGEVYIGGAGLARGYHNRSALTAERFVKHPLSDDPEARLYRTGDLAWQQSDGTLQFMGRADHQVKIRGFRVELGDIEAALCEHDSVQSAAVITQDDTSASQQLVAYVVPQAASVSERVASGEEGGRPDEPQASPPMAQARETDQWQQIWDAAYRSGDHPELSTEFNFSGYNNSFTGALLPAADVAEWTHHTVERILALQPKRVLEIGCGMGLLLFRVAPRCDRYWAIDPTPAAIEHISQRLEQDPEAWSHVAVRQGKADAIATLLADLAAPGSDRPSFDTMVINSVIQYFPSVDYLVAVIEQLLQHLEPGGRLFIGDVRHLGLRRAFHTAVQLHPLTDPRLEQVDAEERARLRQRIQTRLSQEHELLLEPDFFRALVRRLEPLSAVTLQLKRGECRNELNDFRYDVVLHKAAHPEALPELSQAFARVAETGAMRWLDAAEQCQLLAHSERSGLLHLAHHLHEVAPGSLGFRDIPNPRLYELARACEQLEQVGPAPSAKQGSADSERFEPDSLEPDSLEPEAIAGEAIEGIDPEAIEIEPIEPELWWSLEKMLPYQVHLTWAASGKWDHYDVRLYRRAEGGTVAGSPYAWADINLAESPLQESEPWSAYANRPGSIQTLPLPPLKRFLQSKLPAYMVPSHFVPLEVLPLTPNGKVDRQALPPLVDFRAGPGRTVRPPQTAIEQQIAQLWGDILGLDSISLDDNFFDLGGHSLLVADLVSRLRQTLGIELPLLMLFQAPTLERLAEAIAPLLDSSLDSSLGSSLASSLGSLEETEQMPSGLEPSQSEARQAPVLQSTSDPEAREASIVAQMWADSQLDPEIRAMAIAQATSALPLSERDPSAHSPTPRRILLTGATGFFGAFLLRELLSSTEATIDCLVRAETPTEAQRKLENNLERYQLPWEEQRHRLRAHCGDLSQPNLGLSPQRFNQLAHSVDAIYHNGAFVNLLYPYPALRAVNVLGTQEVLRLACRGQRKPIHYVSTLDVIPAGLERDGRESDRSEITEGDALLAPELIVGGYAQSKWVAERLLHQAQACGLPNTIYRLGMVVGHSETGASKANDLVARLIQGVIQLGLVPELDIALNLTPVDYAARALVQLSHCAQNVSIKDAASPELSIRAVQAGLPMLELMQPSPTFHIANSQNFAFSDLADSLSDFGYDIQRIPYGQWRQALAAWDQPEDNALSPLFDLFQPDSPTGLAALGLPKISQVRSLATIQSLDLQCPRINSAMIHTYLMDLMRIQGLPTPEQQAAVSPHLLNAAVTQQS